MAPHTRQAREAERTLSVQTLAIASISSAVAAIVVSQFWKGGTAPAAAVTPIVVSIVSELLRKPTQAISSRVTGDRAAVLPEGTGAGPPARSEATATVPARDLESEAPATERLPPPLHQEGRPPKPSSERETRSAGQVSYHRAGRNGAGGPAVAGRRLPVRVVALTAGLAILIGATIVTVPELIAGESVGKGRGGTTLFGGGQSVPADRDGSEPQESEQPQQQQDDGAQQQDEQQPQAPPREPESGSEQKSSPSQPPRTTPPQSAPQPQPQPQQPQQSQPGQAPPAPSSP